MCTLSCHNHLFIPPLLLSYWMSSGCSVQTTCSRTLSLRKLLVKCEEGGWSAGTSYLLREAYLHCDLCFVREIDNNLH